MEKPSNNHKKHYMIGIDEVGRGPLAGPITVTALILPNNLKLKAINLKLPLRDSKKLSQNQREEWFKWIKLQKIPYIISSVSPAIIDKINISQAANLAATRSVLKLLTKLPIQQYNNITIFLDGGLYLNLKFKNQKSKLQFKNQNLKMKTIIRGDELVPAISLASIVAKVHRDKLMEKMHKKYPQYCFDKHKGYGTKLHIANIKKYGISKIHRKSFLLNLKTP